MTSPHDRRWLWTLLVLLPLAGGFAVLDGLIRAFRWTEPVTEELGLAPVEWPPPGPFRRALVLVFDGVHPSRAFDPAVCPNVAGLRDRARYGTAVVPYVAFTNTCIRTMLAGVGIDLLAAMKNFRPDRFGEDNLFRRVRAAGGSTAVVTDDILWESLFADDLDHVEFVHTPADALPEAGDLLVGAALPAVWQAGHRLVVAHFAGLDLMGHRIGTVRRAYRDHLAQVDAVLPALVEGLRDDELLVVLSDHGSDRRGGHAGGEPEGRQSFFLCFTKSGRIVPGDAGHVPQQDLCPTLAAALGLALPAVSEGTVRTDWFAIDDDGRAAMRRANLAQLRAGPARAVPAAEAEALADPPALLRAARRHAGTDLAREAWLYVAAVLAAVMLATALVRGALHGRGSARHAQLAASVAIASSLLAFGGAVALLGEDFSQSLSPWWIRGTFVALFAVLLPLSLPFAERLRERLPDPGLMLLPPCLAALGLVPLTIRTGLYQLVTLGLGAAAGSIAVLRYWRRERSGVVPLLVAAAALGGLVGTRLWLERLGIDVRIPPTPLDGAAGAAAAIGAFSAVLWPTWRGGPSGRCWFATATCAASLLVRATWPGDGLAVAAIAAVALAGLALAWARAGAPIAAPLLLATYAPLATGAELALIGALLVGVTALLRGLRFADAGFLRIAYAVPLALAVYVYALYALDEPITFERINVLIGDLAGVGGRAVLPTILLAATKYALPMWLLLAVVTRDAPRQAVPLAALLGWAFVLRLCGAVVVVSNHPDNFGEVTRISGESIYAINLLLMLTLPALLAVWSPALRAAACPRRPATASMQG